MRIRKLPLGTSNITGKKIEIIAPIPEDMDLEKIITFFARKIL